jgi:hypothetical protein
MKIYVAGSSRELQRAQHAMTLVRNFGHVLAHDWVAEIQEAGEPNPVAADLEQRKAWARMDLERVAASDWLWFLVPQTPSTGAWVELGCALGWPATRIVSSGANPEQSIFTALVDRHFETDTGAAAWLLPQH